MRPRLPDVFLRRPIAHRALHDRRDGRPENSLAAIRAATARDLPVEIDVQLTADGEAVVFHDDRLDRLTDETGPVRERTVADLTAIPLKDGAENIPTLAQVLAEPSPGFLIEIKDQDGALGPGIGALEEAVARAVQDSDATVALMSFNPHSIVTLSRLLPDVPRGLTTCSFGPEWPDLPEATRAELAKIAMYDEAGASFISHHWPVLDSPRVAELKADGATILCWTIRSAKDEQTARKIADSVTFEGYLP
ncbi:glycerophosphodiester phosphodiesterase family protein [Pelagovum pacificum]|uniref:Phosphodiesterase n=1 Tax=Pelagovum pacificum TaxID=2588711 RepID=A0A5C5GHZ8_9RHOB|nr:glycerophosphodiester phosphodiesterase family protein [Pelagovum pacificum]QQA45044.1 phosphodiesterase [Pelagovum pacificum]TNY34415.1 phosphodiesterase [Pelagovum pacificum]